MSVCNNISFSGNCTKHDNIGVSFVALFLGVILTLSVTANGIVCFVFYKKPQLLNVSNSFVCNLCCCALVFSLLVLPFTLTSVFASGWIFQDIWCNIQGYLFTLCLTEVHFSLLLISVDRNYAIMKSLRYVDVFTPRLSRALITASWIFSGLAPLPPLIGWGDYQYNIGQYTCGLNWMAYSSYLYVFFVVCLALPLLVQAFCYLCIFKAAIGHSKRASKIYPISSSTVVKESRETTTEDQEMKSSLSNESEESVKLRYRNIECKAVRTIFLLALTYLICWLPYLVVSFLKLRRGIFTIYTESLAICCVFLSGFINPVIYVFMNRITWHEIKKFFCGLTMREAKRSSTGNSSDDYYSTTLTQVSGPSGRFVSLGSQKNKIIPKSSSTSRMLEMKTIAEEEADLDSKGAIKSKHSGSITEKLTQKNIQTSSSCPIVSSLQTRKPNLRESQSCGLLSSITEEKPCFVLGPHPSMIHSVKDFSQSNVNVSSCSRSPTTTSNLGSRKQRKGKRDRGYGRNLGSFLYLENSFEFPRSSRRQNYHKYRNNRKHGRRFSTDETALRGENWKIEQTFAVEPLEEKTRSHSAAKDPNVFVVSSGESLNLTAKTNIAFERSRRFVDNRLTYRSSINFDQRRQSSERRLGSDQRDCLSA